MKNRYFSLLAILVLLCLISGCSKKTFVENKYPSGSIKERYYLLNKKFHGEYKAYFEDGILRAQGEFSRNVMVGEWRIYYPDSKLMSVTRYKKGKLVYFDAWDQNSIQVIKAGTGTDVQYYPSGKKKSVITYKKYLPDGTWLFWFENGVMQSEMHYMEGKATGVWKYWDRSGVILNEAHYKDGEPTGIWKYWDQNGNLTDSIVQ